MKVPFVDLAAQHREILGEVLEAVKGVIGSGNFILGEHVGLFEEKFAQYVGIPHAVGVNSGTDALVLALKAHGIGKGDEVITAPNSFLASASAVALAGATPAFADVGEDSNLDPGALEERISNRTRAVIIVHLSGRPARMEPLLAAAGKHGLLVIEDCAQAVGAEHEGRRVGTFGDAGCFSLHPLKILNACGDGGIVVTKSGKVASWLKKARNHGLRDRDTCEFWSLNSRLDALQASILKVKMGFLEKWIESRRGVAKMYREGLSGVEGLDLPPPEPLGMKSVYSSFVIRHAERDGLREYLQEADIETKIHYPVPIHLQPAASRLGYRKGEFPECERQSERILSLPVHSGLDREQVESVIARIRAFSTAP